MLQLFQQPLRLLRNKPGNDLRLSPLLDCQEDKVDVLRQFCRAFDEPCPDLVGKLFRLVGSHFFLVFQVGFVPHKDPVQNALVGLVDV